MIRLKTNRGSNLPAISTASLPDIVFILLFFFMTVVTINDQQLMVENTLPFATEAEKLEKTENSIAIFVGRPKGEHIAALGTTPRIQLGNRFVNMDQVAAVALGELYTIPEHLRNSATIALKADRTIKMGVILDIKEALRQVNLFKINYTTVQGDVFQNIEQLD
ncbi:MAG: biopolymer transporter ExbD [Bacteroidota bacterium]